MVDSGRGQDREQMSRIKEGAPDCPHVEWYEQSEALAGSGVTEIHLRCSLCGAEVYAPKGTELYRQIMTSVNERARLRGAA